MVLLEEEGITNNNNTPRLFDLLSLNVTTSGRNCNTIFDVLTSKMPNADRSKHVFVCVGDFVLIKSELQNKYDRENCNLWPVIL